MVTGIITNKEKVIKEPALRNTRQRKLIRDTVVSSGSHPTANEIYLAVRKKNPGISLGTVYRNLDKLTQIRQIRSFAAGENKLRFDGTLEEHHHVRCVRCGIVKDIWHVNSCAITKKAVEETGFRMLAAKLELTGLCPQCKGKRIKGKKSKS